MFGGGRLWLRAAGAGTVLLALSLFPARAQEPVFDEWDFGADTAGWFAHSGSVNHEVVAGDGAARIASAGGSLLFCSQQWLSPSAEPGASYAASAEVHDSDPANVGTRLALQFMDAGNALLPGAPEALLEAKAEAFQHLTIPASIAPAGAAYVRICLFVDSAPLDASVAIDDVRILEVAPAPTPTPTPPPPPEVVEPSATPTATATSTPTPTPTPTPTAKPTRTPAPTPTPPAASLRNGNFTSGAEGWDLSRADVTFEALSPDLGVSMVIRASGTSTVWAQQLVLVTPGTWYDASALLAAAGGVREGWIRVAWYASPSGAGSQMSTDDSESVTSLPATAIGEAWASVSTGPVQAPEGAASARIRVLLAPEQVVARLAVDEVAFVVTSAPRPTPTPTPSPTPVPSPTIEASPSPTPTSTPPPAAISGAGGSGGGTTTVAGTPPPTPRATSDAQRWLRLTEVMPDPPESGRDADFEWIEITNLGTAPADLAGMSVRDNAAVTPLPDVRVWPGEKFVIAASRAHVAAGARLDGSIGNGLGNEQDRLDLVGPDGVVVDSLAYGGGAPLPAPDTGTSLHRWFDAAGFPVGAAVGLPSPGFYSEFLPGAVSAEAPPASDAEPQPDASTAAPSSSGVAPPDPATWLFLLAIAGGALGGAVMQRVSAILRGEGHGRARREREERDDSWWPTGKRLPDVPSRAR